MTIAFSFQGYPCYAVTWPEGISLNKCRQSIKGIPYQSSQAGQMELKCVHITINI